MASFLVKIARVFFTQLAENPDSVRLLGQHTLTEDPPLTQEVFLTGSQRSAITTSMAW